MKEHAKDSSKTKFSKVDSRLDCVRLSKQAQDKKFRSDKLQASWKEKKSSDYELSHFLGLTNEIWMLILEGLSVEDLVKFGKTCQKANELSEAPSL